MRNYLFSKKNIKFGGPLLAALNIFGDPLLASLKFGTTSPTYLMATNNAEEQSQKNERNKLRQKQKNASKEHNDLLPKKEKKRQGKQSL